jgi:AraC-like DNA-binding protein
VELLGSETSEFHHFHHSFELYYPLEGELKIQVGDEVLDISPGHMLFVKPGTWHGTVYQPDVTRRYFIMVFDFLEEDLEESWEKKSGSFPRPLKNVLEYLQRSSHLVVPDHQQCHRLIHPIAEELHLLDFGWETMVQSMYMSFLVSAFRNLVDKDLYIRYQESDRPLNIPTEITKYMHKNYNKNITLQDVAEAMHISPRHISRIFEAYFGTTFSKTLSTYRLNYAKDYLYKTNDSIEEIAHQVGFSSSRTLLRLFKEVEGITTTEYRRLVKKTP